MSDAIANALPTCNSRTPSRVGFARGRKLLRLFTNPAFQQQPIFHSQRGIWRDWEAQIEPDMELRATA